LATEKLKIEDSISNAQVEDGKLLVKLSSDSVVNATQLNGISLSTASPSDGNIIKYDLTSSAWIYTTDATGGRSVISVNGQTGAVTLDTDDIGEGSTNLYFTNERVDDRVSALLTAGTAINFTYNDTAGTLKTSVIESQISHLNIDNVGSNTHGQIDSHISDTSIHYSENTIDHLNILNIGSNAHSVIDTHLSSTANPHIVTASQVGNITAQWNADQLQGVTLATLSPLAGQVLKYNGTLNEWRAGTDVSSTGGGVAWGDITGDLSNQADLVTTLANYVLDTDLTSSLAEYVKRDGSVTLTDNWDIGDTRKILTDEIRARDGDGLALYSTSSGIFINSAGEVGINTATPDETLDVNGHAIFNQAHGELFISSIGGVTINTSTAGTWHQVTPMVDDLITGGDYVTTNTASNLFRIGSKGGGIYKVQAHISFGGSANARFVYNIMTNDVISLKTEAQIVMDAASRRDTASFSALRSFSDGDEIKLKVSSPLSSKSVTIYKANFNIVRINR
jgi:hypothetical protein